jgi:hypothetical protein
LVKQSPGKDVGDRRLSKPEKHRTRLVIAKPEPAVVAAAGIATIAAQKQKTILSGKDASVSGDGSATAIGSSKILRLITAGHDTSRSRLPAKRLCLFVAKA